MPEASMSSVKSINSGSSAPQKWATGADRHTQGGTGAVRHQAGDTLLILGEAETGLIVSRPDVLNNLADEILNNVKKED